MARHKMQSFAPEGDGFVIAFPNGDPNALAQEVGEFFAAQGYKLEDGSPTGGYYGVGSDMMRMLFGAFVRRYKFFVQVQPHEGMLWVKITKGMSGAMGGIIGYAAMNKETKRLTEALQGYFA